MPIGQHNLPEDLTSLIGRERDRKAVTELLRDHRLVTLLGVGGVGKTRLALSAGRSAVGDFADGVWLAELAPLTDPATVLDAVAEAAGVVLRGDRAPLESLIGGLGSRQILILLDNCEHLILACAELVERLLRSCSQFRVLATSREPLGVPGETGFPVSPLAIAEDTQAQFDRLAEMDAVRLFVERAQAVRPDFRLAPSNAPTVAQICRRLDGLPLAIELAAARLRVLTPAQIAARLDDRFQILVDGSRTAPARQQTLEATVAWSYDLLDVEDRRLFDRLSLFAGSFSLQAPRRCARRNPQTSWMV